MNSNARRVFITSNKFLLLFYYAVMRVETALLLYIRGGAAGKVETADFQRTYKII